MKKFGVIDLGTNTFHLLIAAFDQEGKLREIYRERRFIKLAEGGIESIGQAPFTRGLEALRAFRQLLDLHEVQTLCAIGTAALRTADNGEAFIREARAITGIEVRLISGDDEARLIYEGVRQAVPPGEHPALIMDIGGGSVEFIIADQHDVRWARSFPIGLAVLYRHFHRTDPISAVDVQAIHVFLHEQLAPLQEQLKKFRVAQLVGAAGTFEVLADLLSEQRRHPLNAVVSLEKFDSLYQKITGASLAERRRMAEVPPDRADMIVVALILIRFMAILMGIRQINVSAYAMKEGVLYEMKEGKM